MTSRLLTALLALSLAAPAWAQVTITDGKGSKVEIPSGTTITVPDAVFTVPPVTPPVEPPVEPPVQPPVSDWSAETPFASNTYWRQPIPANAVYRGPNDPRTRSLKLAPVAYPNYFRFTQWVNYGKATDKKVRVRVNSGYITGNFSAGKEAWVDIYMPANARRDPGVNGGADDSTWRCHRNSDGHAIFIDPDGQHAHEFWQFCNDQPNGTGQFHAVSYAKTFLGGQGWNYTALAANNLGGAVQVAGWGSTRAYGGSSLGGLIRKDEVLKGSIKHKLALLLPANVLYWNGNEAQSIVKPPATRPDLAGGTGANQTIKHGQLFGIPKSIDVTKQGFSAAGLALALALQTYGASVVDVTGGSTYQVDGIGANADGAALNSAAADRAKIWTMLEAVDIP